MACSAMQRVKTGSLPNVLDSLDLSTHHYTNNVNNKKWHCTRMDCQTIASHPLSLILGKMDDQLSKFSLLASKEELSVITDGIQDINLI